MANKDKKYKENVSGKYYVDDQCIACDACHQIAGKHFALDEEDGHAFVVLQPSNHQEEELCQEAMESCPVESIGDDGDFEGTQTKKVFDSRPNGKELKENGGKANEYF